MRQEPFVVVMLEARVVTDARDLAVVVPMELRDANEVER